MGLTHCPICVGLAVLSVLRSGAVAMLIWSWLAKGPGAPQKGSVRTVAAQVARVTLA